MSEIKMNKIGTKRQWERMWNSRKGMGIVRLKSIRVKLRAQCCVCQYLRVKIKN